MDTNTINHNFVIIGFEYNNFAITGEELLNTFKKDVPKEGR